MGNEIACLLCGAPSELKYKSYPGYKMPSTYDIYYCNSCFTSFSNPQGDVGDIYNLIYNNGKEVRWYDRYWMYSQAVKEVNNPLNYLAEKEDIYWAIKKTLETTTNKLPKSTNILEIGSGLGYLTYALNQEGYNTVGIDISQEAVRAANQNFGNFYCCEDLEDFVKNNESKFDFIIFTELIEHLSNIFDFFEKVTKLLKEKGRIILTTPNKTFYPASVIWATDLPPVHFWWFSEESLKYIAKEQKLIVSFLDFKDYYSKHKTIIDLTFIKIPITPPVFNEDGTLIQELNKEGKTVERVTKSFGLKISNYLNSKKSYLLKRLSKKILIPSSRGPVICAILSKDNN